MLATQGHEGQPATDDVQHQHDGVCHMPGEPGLARAIAARDAVVFDYGEPDRGDGYPVPGTDWSSGMHRRGKRGQERWTDLVERGATLIPILCGECGSDIDGAGGQFASGMGAGVGGVPRDVWDPPFLQLVLWADGRRSTQRGAGPGRGCGRITINEHTTQPKAAFLDAAFFF